VGADSAADIQLSGLGIQPQHCQLHVEGGALYMTPLGGARCFVNGAPAPARALLGHADRLLWGNHHFFRVNCPKAQGTRPSPTCIPFYTLLILFTFSRHKTRQSLQSAHTLSLKHLQWRHHPAGRPYT
jgi:kinesin family member 13